ncbi:MAG: hypothetical protein IJ317_02050 [Clostridia bacterium]|nr:hypothetical protein [Clostridia bacterium]
MAVAGLVISITALVMSLIGGFVNPWCCVFALPLAVVGLVLSIVGGKKLKSQNQSSGIGTAGMVIGIIATVFSAILFFTCGLCVICVATTL